MRLTWRRIASRSRLIAAAGAFAAVAAAGAAPARAAAAAGQAWAPFVLVAGLLLVGTFAAEEGFFAAVGALAARAPGGACTLFALLLLAEAVVTAVLNLDTAVVFMTPVLLHGARRRGLDETPFLYGAVFMANSASLLLPGSNLTNLIVLAREPVPGHVFAARMVPAWAAAVVGTVVVLALLFRRELAAPEAESVEHPPFRPRAGTLGVAAAAALVLVLQRPALPVLGLGLAVAATDRLHIRRTLAAANPALLLGVFGVTMTLGALARSIAALADLGQQFGRLGSAAVGAAASVLVNNLPAAVVLSAHAPTHPRALLVGLDLGPNLAVSGSLSAILWLQVARASGARPSALRYSLIGALVAPVTLALALGALATAAPRGF